MSATLQLIRVSVRSSRRNQRDLEIAITYNIKGAEAINEQMLPLGRTLSYEPFQS